MKPSEILRKRFMFSDAELYHYANTCPFRYKTYPIDKRNGGKRLISQPSRDLKAVQRCILSDFLSDKLKVHKSATAYRVGKSIVDNAKVHLNNKYLLKMDFKDFFPSIVSSDFVDLLNRDQILEDETEIKLLSKIFFMSTRGRLVLSIGSPGSPLISNAVMFDFDEYIAKKCAESGVDYSRYSDDITFSTNVPKVLFGWPEVVSNVLKELPFPRLRLNEQKTKFSSKKFNRHVTGITLANQGYLSIGRDRKRNIRARVHDVNNLSIKEVLKLSGDIAFAGQVEARFISKLWEKYPVEMREILDRRIDSENSE